MEKIPVSFKEQITKQPDEKYAVVVVTKSDIDLNKFSLVAMDGLENISNGTLSGHQILALAKLKKVASIESDGEMKTQIN